MTGTKNTANKQELTPNSVISLFKSAGVLFLAQIAIYFGLRSLFYGWNHQQLKDLTAFDLGLAFLQGARFDAVIVGPLVFLWLLVLALPVKIIRKTLLGGLILFHLSLLFINFIDIELVNFTGRRFTKVSLYLAGEGQITSFSQYVFLTVMTLFGLALAGWISVYTCKNFRKNFEKVQLSRKIIFFISLLPIVLILSRGGFQYKPISFVDAKVTQIPFSNHFILNTSFTFLKSFTKQTFQKEKYFSESEMLKNLNLTYEKSEKILAKAENYNLVIFIVESLSREYISKQRTPFFKSLIDQGVYFENSYANGRRSIEGIASILAGIPALMEEPFLNSEFATNDFVGLGHLLKNKNYQTSFFHGAKNGSMRFDVFTKASGFDKYYGLNEFPDKSKQDGVWGIYDEPFFKFVCDKSEDLTAPFSQVVFTLSTHQPYKTPDDFEVIYKNNYNNLDQGKEPILKTISYFDYALENYFKCARGKDWFKKTVFLFVADHTGPEVIDTKITKFKSKFEIPILFYASDKSVFDGLKTDQYAQQIDILPTLNDLMNLNLKAENHLARSLFIAGPKTIALFSDQHYELVGDTDLSDSKLKAIKQYFSLGLYDNRLYYPLGK